MAGYLDQFGVADAQREKRTKFLIAIGAAVVVLAAIGYYTFRNWSEERVMTRFVDLLREKNYRLAYTLWGCTPQTPCRYYPFDKFNEDWGPNGTYKNAAAMKVEHVDSCGGSNAGESGVVFNISYQGDDFGLWVDRSNKTISYAPWSRCPGPHLQLGEFFRKLRGGDSR